MIKSALVCRTILYIILANSFQDTAHKAKDKFMLPRLLRAKKKLAKYATKLDDSPYYLVVRILNPECRTAFLKDKDKISMTYKGEKKLYVVRKLQERFRNNALPPALYKTIKNKEPTLEFTEQLSAFHKACR